MDLIRKDIAAHSHATGKVGEGGWGRCGSELRFVHGRSRLTDASIPKP